MINKKLTDEEIVTLIQQGNVDVAIDFYEKYKRLSYKVALAFISENPKSGIEKSDYLAICYQAIHKAIFSFRNDMDNFYCYWEKVANNDLLKLVSRDSYTCRAKTFDGVSLDAQNDGYLENSSYLGSSDSHIDQILLLDSIIDILTDKNNDFTLEEQNILLMTIEGYSPKEIAKTLKIKQQKVYYILKNTQEKFAILMRSE